MEQSVLRFFPELQNTFEDESYRYKNLRGGGGVGRITTKPNPHVGGGVDCDNGGVRGARVCERLEIKLPFH